MQSAGLSLANSDTQETGISEHSPNLALRIAL